MQLGERSAKLVDQVTCPHCWERFSPAQVLHIARHGELRNDPVVGQDEFIRFRASRFNAAGLALDPTGMPCSEIACPRCHLEMPRKLLEVPALFSSIVGAPGSGKTYFLAAMTWELRQRLDKFGLGFVDASPTINANLLEAEQRLFLSETPQTPVVVEKTVENALGAPHLYRQVVVGGQRLEYLRPLQFLVSPIGGVPGPERVLVLYDNAGEHFLPGSAGVSEVTDHMARSQTLFFLLDPTQDPRMRARCEHLMNSDAANAIKARAPTGAVTRQETILSEAAVRMQGKRGPAAGKVKCPLIVILAKADLWGSQLGIDIEKEPFVEYGRNLKLSLSAVQAASDRCRSLLQDVAPAFVTAAEQLFTPVRYVPVSSLGRPPTHVLEVQNARYDAIRPVDIRPRWAMVPMMLAIQSMMPIAKDAVGSAESRP